MKYIHIPRHLFDSTESLELRVSSSSLQRVPCRSTDTCKLNERKSLPKSWLERDLKSQESSATNTTQQIDQY